MYLYLTTTGRRTGLRREIEIWFAEHGGRFYVIAERREHANWVRNIAADPRIHIRVGERHFAGIARTVDVDREPELAGAVRKVFDGKYGWSDGLIVELAPEPPLTGP
jgi:deazaflavin-dependent oxidoreductase (nitroreductase family)